MAARDVLLSKKIVFCIVAVPILWITYAFLLLMFSSLRGKTIAVLFVCCPLFSYLGITWVQAGIRDIKDLRPAFLRLSPEFRRVAPTLPALRIALQRDVRRLVKKYGPELGALYYDKSDAWEQHYSADDGGSHGSGPSRGGDKTPHDFGADDGAAVPPSTNNFLQTAVVGESNDAGAVENQDNVGDDDDDEMLESTTLEEENSSNVFAAAVVSGLSKKQV